ncbi:MAG TPA: sugar-binding protein [Verrucomicrobiae bacterium]|nr:sugar-binding protein [Verrucomicrobiae bacterium]
MKKVLLSGFCALLAITPSFGAKKLRLAFVTNNASDFWTIARAGCDKAASELPNVTLDFKIPGDGSAATQRRIVDDLLARGIDGIAISPIDPANQILFLNEVAKQTLLICQDSDAPNSDRACYVGTDNTAAGRQAGELIKEALPNGGKIVIFVGTLDAQNARERYAGIKESLKGSNVHILDVRTDDTDRVRAKANVLDSIVKYPDVACLVGLWSYNGPAILNAVKESDKVGKIKIVCFDEEDETLQGVRDGAIFATVVQQPYEFGYKAIELMNKVLNGDKAAVPASKDIIVPTLAIEKANVDEFAAKLKKLRGR